MKILCFTDSLATGGAQRQLATLAVEFRKRGHDVRFLTYRRGDAFTPLLDKADVPCQTITARSAIGRLLEVHQVVQSGWQDVLFTFLEAPCLYAEVASAPRRNWILAAGEQLATPSLGLGLWGWFRQAHRLADCVVTNSHTNQLILQRRCRYLVDKVVTIYNLVDVDRFAPEPERGQKEDKIQGCPIRIVVASNYLKKKNMLGLAKALKILRDTEPEVRLSVDWYGERQPDEPKSLDEVIDYVRANHLQESIRFHEAVRNIAPLLVSADAVALFSYYEGLPNIICEAMSCGKPVILSDVCDAGNLVVDADNGFLCDPTSAESIAIALARMARLSSYERRRMGAKSRLMAAEMLAPSVVMPKYEALFQRLLARRGSITGYSWPRRIPPSAFRTLARWGVK